MFDEAVLRRVVSEVVQPLSDDIHSLQTQVQGLSAQGESLQAQVQGLSAQGESLQAQVQGLSEQGESLQTQVGSLQSEIRGSEVRLAEAGRLHFRQLADLYRATLEKVEHLERHLGERIDGTRGAIEALRSSLERQDFRSDELGRRLTRLETRSDL